MKNWRTNLIFGIIIIISATIIGRLIYLQVIKGDYYRALAQGQQKSFSEVQGERGKIFLQEKGGGLYPAATNNVSKFVFAIPPEIENKDDAADKLSKVLNLDKAAILKKISNDDNFYAVIKDKLTENEVSFLETADINGIDLGEESLRFYPHSEVASNVLGFFGGNNEGQYGIEGFYDAILKGQEEFVTKERGLTGFIFSDPQKLLLQNGSDLVLSVDCNIQFFAESLLKKAEKDFAIEGGQIIVMDPFSGKIVAMASTPSYDPNNYSKVTDLDVFRNESVQKAFEPGSSFKPFTIAAALDVKAITPETTYVDDGLLRIGGYPITNFDKKIWGKRTMAEVLEKSLNTGAVFAERQIGNSVFRDYLERFGFFEKTGIDLQGEVVSGNKEFNSGRDISFATAAFGQGIEITPIQLVRAFSAIANGGNLVTPFVVEKVIEPTGETILTENTRAKNNEQAISKDTASQLTSMLVDVVEKGTARRTIIPGYYIAGKTGTAQIAYPALGINRSGYSEKTIQTFVGFAPAFSPRFIALVKLNNPNVITSEISAVPVFKDLAKYIIDYWEIPPDYDVNGPAPLK